MTGIELGFPIWVRATHWFNVLFMTLLIRSGIAILAGHPMLYWNQDCRPGSEWLKLSRKQMPKDRLWTSKDEEVGLPVLAGPAGRARPGPGALLALRRRPRLDLRHGDLRRADAGDAPAVAAADPVVLDDHPRRLA